MSLRGGAAVIGVAESALGEVGEAVYPLDLAGQAAAAAMADAGVGPGDIDALFSAIPGRPMSNLDVAEYLGVRPRFTDSTMIGGSSFLAHLHHATMAIATGEAETALIVYGSTPRSDGKFRPGRRMPVDQPDYEAPHRPRNPVTGYALATARHIHEFGTTREQLAEVAVAARKWAQLNPVAWRRDDLTLGDVLASPVVSSPLTVRDCCLVTDGGGAVVVTTPERARDAASKPAYVLGAGEAHWHRSISAMPDLTTTCATESGRRAFAMAGLAPADVDVLQLYDAFTITPILFLEDLGFCEKGEGGSFVADGAIAPGGRLPVNTSGGGLSYCHPGMYGIFTIIEAVRQLRGQAGARQVADVEVALAHGNGGQLSSQATVLLGSEATL